MPIFAGGWVLAGCTDDTAGYQFATDPRPTREATVAVVATQPPSQPTPTAPPRRSFADLVVPRGAPERIYFQAGPQLWTVVADGSDPTRVFGAEAGETVLDISASPSRDRVAVLVELVGGEREVRILAPDGETIEVVEDVPAPPLVASTPATPDASDGATPVSASAPATLGSEATPVVGDPIPVSLDWSPQGDQLLVGFDPGGLVALSVDDLLGVRVVASVAEVTRPGEAAWSPTGQQVAFTARAPTGEHRALVVTNANDRSAGSVVLQSEVPGRAVFEFAWLPDGRSILFTEGDSANANAVNADLWRVRADGSDRQLVASAGSAAPVANIDRFVPSPDGRAVAYTVVVPGEREPMFHSLWLRDLVADQGVRVDVPTGSEVTDIWWTNQGLIYRTIPVGANDQSGSEVFQLYRVGEDGVPQLILRAALDSGTPAATPVAG